MPPEHDSYFVPTTPATHQSVRVIDIHGHAGAPKVDALIVARPEFGHGMQMMAKGAGKPSMQHNADVMLPRAGARFASLEARLTDLDNIGIDLQVVSPSPHIYSYWAEEALAEDIVGLANEAMVDLVAQAPERLAGLGIVALQHPEMASRQITELMASGLKGFEISTAVGAKELSDPSFDTVWKTAEATGALVFVHPLGCSLGDRLNRDYLYNTIGQPTETTVALSHLIFSGVLDRFPGLKILAAHGGGYLPHYIGRSDHAWKVRPEIQSCANLPSSYLQKIWFDTVIFDDVYLGHLIERVGADRVVFGTDYAFDMGDYDLQRLAGSLPDDITRAAVLGESAAQLLGL